MTFLGTIYLNLFLLLIIAKTLKFHGAHIERFLNFSDIIFIFICSVGAFALWYIDNLLSNVVLCLMLMTGAVLIFTDAILFRNYSLELEPSTIKIFLADKAAFLMEGKAHIKYLILSRISVGVLLWFCLNIALVFFRKTVFLSLVQSMFLSYAIFVISKSRGTWYFVLCYILAGLGFFYMAPMFSESNFYLEVAVMLSLTLTGMLIRRLKNGGDFFRSSGSFTHIIGFDSLPGAIDVKVTEQDSKLLSVQEKQPEASEKFGECKNANILLISIESLGRNYLDYYGGKAKLKIFNKLAKESLVSDCHYCISANTNDAIFYLYGGGYQAKQPTPLQYLAKTHDTFFISSWKTKLFQFEELVKSLGFSHIVGEEKLIKHFNLQTSSHWGLADSVISKEGMQYFFDNKDKNKPFFLHLLNIQTHASYHVANKGKYNQHLNSSLKGKYLNAIEESGEFIEDSLRQLEAKGLLDNTIVILCGDHGESFGQAGYKAHSNAITSEQILSPFLLWHPQIDTKQVNLSSHFDIMPTILDLLGISDVKVSQGQSLFSDKEPPLVLLHTKTRRGNTPASFGYADKDKKIIIDRIYKKILYVDHEDNALGNLSTEEKQYYSSLLSRALEAQGLLS